MNSSKLQLQMVIWSKCSSIYRSIPFWYKRTRMIHSCASPKHIMTSNGIITTMMTSSNENNCHVTGHFLGEFTGHQWVSLTKVSNAELWCFLWSATDRTFAQTIETPVIWVAIALIMTSLLWHIQMPQHRTISTLNTMLITNLDISQFLTLQKISNNNS